MAEEQQICVDLIHHKKPSFVANTFYLYNVSVFYLEYVLIINFEK